MNHKKMSDSKIITGTWNLFILVEFLLNIYQLNSFCLTQQTRCSYLIISGQQPMNTQTLSANSQFR